MVDRTRKNLEGEKDTINEITDAVDRANGNLLENRDETTGKFVKGKSGNPSGRPRKKKTFNRKVVIERCVEQNCDPIAILAMFANGDAEGLDAPYLQDRQGNAVLDEDGNPIRTGVPLKYRLDAAKDLMGYMVPKLRSVEVVDPNKGREQEESVPQVVVMLPSNSRDYKETSKIEADNSDHAVFQLTEMTKEKAVYDDDDEEDED